MTKTEPAKRRSVGQTVSRVVSAAGAVLLVVMLMLFMLALGLLLGASGLAWLGAVIVAGMLGWVLWDTLK
jgi:multidrug efflux pump subunit AcrB